MKTENLTSLGTIVASFLAASCCIGPAVFVIFGTTFGFLSKLSFMESLQPFLIGLALALFSFSFWRLYLKKPECDCTEDVKSRTIARGILWVGAGAIAISASFQSVLLRIYQ